VIDPENLGRNPRPTASEASSVRETYDSLVPFGTDDHVVVAFNHGGLFEFGSAWDPARLVVRSGKDGADLALLQVLESEDVADRFDGIVIGSGDGIFAEVAIGFREAGLEVTVVSEPEALSSRLARAADRIINFAPVPPTGPTLVPFPITVAAESGMVDLGRAA
jgi:hypothetical protein